jgi:putative FmdB family regulatory protein
MPRYDYECPGCGRGTEVTCRMSERPETVLCACGGAMGNVIRPTPNIFVKGADYEFKREHIVGNNGAVVGRTAEQQHAMYQRQIGEWKKAKDARKRSGKASKGGVEVIGVMPGEMVDSIGYQEGDKEAVVKDPIPFMKATGTYFGE